MKASIQITDGVPARGTEDARLEPLRTVRATVDWPLPPEDSEDTVPPDVVATLSRALAACGKVAFRYDEPLTGAEMSIPPAPRSAVNRFLNMAGLGRDSFGLVEPTVVAALFAYGGWSYALQSVLVFDPDIDASPILDLLRQDLDWRGRTLPDGVRLLFGPGHDGDFAVIAATDQSWLDRFRAMLR